MERTREALWLGIVLILVVSCHLARQSSKEKAEFDVQGHRGCRGLMPENTIAAMYRAVELGVNTLEMDAVITRDKQVVLSHEPFFNHEITTKPDGSYISESEEKSFNIYQMSYEEVRKFDVGKKMHPRFPQQMKISAVKPLLADVIDSVENYCRVHHFRLPFYNIETKTNPATDNRYHPEPAAFDEILMKLILSRNVQDRVIIQSFDFRTLKYIYAQYPSMKTAMLVEDFDKRTLDEQLIDLGFTPDIYSPAYSLVTEELIHNCHQRMIKVIPWTVNDVATIKKLKDQGVDGIITDYPNMLSPGN